jgi:phosphoesterase RecJ-like protein
MNYSQEFSKVAQLIKEKNNVLLAVHERPDGDALGSMIAMFSLLRKFGDKRVVMFSKDPVPPHLAFLPYSERVTCERSEFVPDLFFGFDYGDFSRLGIDYNSLSSSIIVTFDHHPPFKQMGDVVIIDTSASSTCEILYNFIKEAGYEISPRIATALLTGIFTDTGGFAHVNTSVATLKAAGDLLRYGVSVQNLHKHTFSRKSPETLRVWGHILKDILCDSDIGMAYVAISLERFRELASSLDDFEGIVNIINTPPDIRFSLLLIEHEPQVIKGSLRSEPFQGVDVSMIARALGGGGHKYAAGFERSDESLKDVLERVKIAASRLA